MFLLKNDWHLNDSDPADCAVCPSCDENNSLLTNSTSKIEILFRL
jgi:hypothetical protein